MIQGSGSGSNVMEGINTKESIDAEIRESAGDTLMSSVRTMKSLSSSWASSSKLGSGCMSGELANDELRLNNSVVLGAIDSKLSVSSDRAGDINSSQLDGSASRCCNEAGMIAWI